MIDWTHIGPSVTAAFLGSLVEFIEALTIVLAVGTVRGWRSAMLGTSIGVLLLAALVAFLGPALGVIPIAVLQLVVGVLLLLFGMRWLRKAILRAAGTIPLHDETEAFAKETDALGRKAFTGGIGWDAIAVATAFKAVVLEGLEVVFIVIAVGTVGHMLIPASAGGGGRHLGLVSRLGAAPPAGPRAREHAQVRSRNSHLRFWGILGRRRARVSLAR